MLAFWFDIEEWDMMIIDNPRWKFKRLCLRLGECYSVTVIVTSDGSWEHWVQGLQDTSLPAPFQCVPGMCHLADAFDQPQCGLLLV